MMVFTHFLSPIGCLRLEGSEHGISAVNRVDTKPCPTGPIPPLLKPAVQQLAEYFRGERQSFDLKLDFGDAPPFHQKVWNLLQEIRYGHTTSYLAIADKLGDKKAVRAVGQANRHNPIAIIIPCHRCIAKNGDLQGYFYGLDTKRQLLDLENPLSFARQGSLF